MGILSGLSGFSDYISGMSPQRVAARWDVAQREQNPMTPVIAEWRGLTQNESFSSLVEFALQRGIAPDAIGNLQGQDLSGVTFDEAGVSRLREVWPEAPDQPLDLRGANLDGVTFRPASTVNHIIIDEVTVGLNTSLKNITFEGFSDEVARAQFGTHDVSGFTVTGAGDHARHMQLTFEGTNAQNGNIANSRFTSIEARAGAGGEVPDLSGLQAHNARALTMDVAGAQLNEADFSGATFAPGSRINSTNLIGTNFEGAKLGDLDLSGSAIRDANLTNVDLTHVNLRGVSIDAASLQGALYRGQVVGEQLSPEDVAKETGITLSAAQPHPSAEKTAATTQGTDSLMCALMQAHSALAGCSVVRTASDREHDADPLGEGVGLAANHEIHRERVEHEVLGRHA